MKAKSVALALACPLVKKSLLSVYWELLKVRLLSMALITLALAFYMEASSVHDVVLLFHALVGGFLVGGGGHAMNQWLEKDLDALMERTQSRPLPAEKIAPYHAMFYGLSLSIAGFVYLGMAVNLLAMVFGMLTWFLYVWVYTPLKQKTIWNTWIGAIPGALPTVIGYVSATNSLSWEAISLFSLLFFWQIPHFFAIAVMYRKDYQRGNYQMLPCKEEILQKTRRHTLGHTLLTVLVSFLPVYFGQAGFVYLAGACLSGVGFLWVAWQFYQSPNVNIARRLCISSIIYLPIVLLALGIDKFIS